MAVYRQAAYLEMERPADAPAKRETLGTLFGELARESASLVRDEVELARQELQRKLKTIRSALLALAIGAVMALIAALVLCAAVIIALAEYVRPWQSALITGLILVMAAGAVIAIGVSRFKHTTLKPEQTLQTLEENKAWLREIT